MSQNVFLEPLVTSSTRHGDLSLIAKDLQDGKFYEVLTSPLGRTLLGHDEFADVSPFSIYRCAGDWKDFITQRIELLFNNESGSERQAVLSSLAIVGIAALHAFLQSNVTGPPLDWVSPKVILPECFRSDRGKSEIVGKQMLANLTVDGETAYQLTPNVELFGLAKIVLNHQFVVENGDNRWARLRVNFWHQRMLSEIAASLQELIYNDLEFLEGAVLTPGSRYNSEAKAQFLLERAVIHIYHGSEVKAREDLKTAARLTGFEYALTGRLGKRTKFQDREISQLVVLAQSTSTQHDREVRSSNKDDDHESTGTKQITGDRKAVKPPNLDLNDDTLLESIAFATPTSGTETTIEEALPESLINLDPANQPSLNPLDSIILLSLASSITNSSPQHGLTREETLPYATRVLEGGSTNWQVYTQALLVRSRIEGYRSRTVERGVLQLQALVDQVIAETESSHSPENTTTNVNGTDQTTSTTFLPRPKPSESASASERLQYVHQLASPTRWVLEAELAARWVSLGGLRTALEIYERLEMWAEAALCWAAVEREDKARKIVRRQLYQRTPSQNTSSGSERNDESDDADSEQFLGDELEVLPANAPRLFCILGDIEKSPLLYERAWIVSNGRYARAQRSLGKHYLSVNDLAKADSAYSKSLKINPTNSSTWFALGCVRLELQDWSGAVNAFSRTVQLDETDAESWSNLAASLLRLPAFKAAFPSPENDNDFEEKPKADPQKHVKEAFVALKRAAKLKRESYRIWQNLLNVSATLNDPPYTDIIIAQQRLIELRGSVEGESCVDAEVVEGLLAHIIASTPPGAVAQSSSSTTTSSNEEQQPRRKRLGLEHMFTNLLTQHITPLITHSRRLWLIAARLALHQNHPSTALSAYEKAWRLTLNKPGWESGGGGFTSSSAPAPTGKFNKQPDELSPPQVWQDVVTATTDLVDAYESLGERERTEGLGAGTAGAGAGTGELVCKDWRFKARSAVRGVLGRGKGLWEGEEGWEGLRRRMDELRG